MTKKGESLYLKLRSRILSWLESRGGWVARRRAYFLMVPDTCHLVCCLVMDKDVAMGDKIRLGAVIIYFFSPIDILPEIILGPIGYLDDIAFGAFALNGIINGTDPVVVARHWAGDKDILEKVRKFLASMDKAIGSGLWRKIRKKMG